MRLAYSIQLVRLTTPALPSGSRSSTQPYAAPIEAEKITARAGPSAVADSVQQSDSYASY